MFEELAFNAKTGIPQNFPILHQAGLTFVQIYFHHDEACAPPPHMFPVHVTDIYLLCDMAKVQLHQAISFHALYVAHYSQ